MNVAFFDRIDAGRQLASRIVDHRGLDTVVVGIPRGGVPVAAAVAKALGAPLDVVLVRKLGVPFQPELAMGAIGEEGVKVLNDDVVSAAAVTRDEIRAVEDHERAELERRVVAYRDSWAPVPLAGKTVIVVDDGVATGATARAACQVVRELGARRVVLAAPVMSRQSATELKADADEVVFVDTPEPFYAVGQFYVDFAPTSDADVVETLQLARLADDPPMVDDELAIDIGPVALAGRLFVPDQARGVVVFAHGSGSSRHSPRNRVVGEALNRQGMGTLLFDLLTAEEELDRANVFDIELLASRLTAVTNWLQQTDGMDDREIAYFGASSGAGAALWSAAELGDCVASVVSRGGRPDLAAARLAEVVAPTLLIVGSRDPIVRGLNEEALRQMRCEARVEVVPGASHLFEEAGTLDRVIRVAGDWFVAHWH